MYFINGSYVKEEDAKISVLDLSILRGFGIFDYLRTYQGRPFHLRDHLQRFQYSAKQLGLNLPYPLEQIATIINTVLELNGYEESSLKIIATGGVSPDQFTPQNPATLIVFAYPLTAYPAHFYTDGIKVATTQLNRSLPFCKTTQYVPGIVALQKGRLQNAQEALYLNAKGEILEATTSNFFGVKNKKLYTCISEEVLAGITREVVLNIAKDRFEICLEPIPANQIDTLDEAFLTASNKEVLPVTAIDENQVGDGQVGPVTKEIMRLFRTYTQQEHWQDLNIPCYLTEETDRSAVPL